MIYSRLHKSDQLHISNTFYTFCIINSFIKKNRFREHHYFYNIVIALKTVWKIKIFYIHVSYIDIMVGMYFILSYQVHMVYIVTSMFQPINLFDTGIKLSFAVNNKICSIT